MTSVDRRVDEAQVALSVALDDGTLTSLFQPIFDLGSMSVVGQEALVRGPYGTSIESPNALFAAARAAGRLAELDAACQRAATDGALAGGLGPTQTLFVNIEPESLTAGLVPFDWFPSTADASPSLVVEITERAITSRPAELIAVLARAREQGFAIAVDDVGADPASLALLPIIAPEVIKLDLSLVQGLPSIEIARIHSAVAAESERSGATILAEGIETEAHLRQARALGATLGQGYLLGRPGPLVPARSEATSWRPTVPPLRPAIESTPFQVVAKQRATSEATRGTLVEMSKLLEETASRLESPGTCLAAFQHADSFTEATARRYGRLASRCSLVAAFAADITADVASAHDTGLRTGRLAVGDPLRREWCVVVVGAHYAAALVALELDDDDDTVGAGAGAGADRGYCYALTHDRNLVLDAARTLVARISAPA